MVESGRKHGPFDFRYPVRRKIATPVRELRQDRDGPRGLEWSVYLARFFPNRRRHDFEALAAYEAYRNALDRAASPPRSPTGRPAFARGRKAERGVVSSRPPAKRFPAAVGAGLVVRTVAPSQALADWESEGGSVEPDAGRWFRPIPLQRGSHRGSATSAFGDGQRGARHATSRLRPLASGDSIRLAF
jgi:hypothetical protein